MQIPGLLVALFVTASILAGCTSSPPASTANHAPEALQTVQLAALRDRNVALDVSYQIRKVKDKIIVHMGTRSYMTYKYCQDPIVPVTPGPPCPARLEGRPFARSCRARPLAVPAQVSGG